MSNTKQVFVKNQLKRSFQWQSFSQNNYFEFHKKFSRQISGTAIGTKFAPPYACIFMDEMETSFLKAQQLHCLDILMTFFYMNTQ